MRSRPVLLAGRDPLHDADAEDQLKDWLDAFDVDDPEFVSALVDRGVGSEGLKDLMGRLSASLLPIAASYLGASLTTHALIMDVAEAGQRISAIVAATKEYTNLDRAPEQEFDVHQGLEATLAVLRPKLTGVEVHRDYRPGLPRTVGFPNELNQVWTNLIDNALDAMDGHGRLRLTTRAEGNCLLVELADSGPGIPPDVQRRIFEPFFTTKDVGKGTGLGLHLSHRIITQRHHGSLTVRSRPGATSFLVRIPVHASSRAACTAAAPQVPEERTAPVPEGGGHA